MNAKLSFTPIAIALFAVVIGASAATPGPDAGYNAFLQKIAADCKPLVIGNDDFGQAIVFNGQGAEPGHYGTFLDRTKALYSGGMSAKEFHDAYALGADGGKFSDKSIQCIIAHVPKQ
jgi:hypothetical protein